MTWYNAACEYWLWHIIGEAGADTCRQFVLRWLRLWCIQVCQFLHKCDLAHQHLQTRLQQGVAAGQHLQRTTTCTGTGNSKQAPNQRQSTCAPKRTRRSTSNSTSEIACPRWCQSAQAQAPFGKLHTGGMLPTSCSQPGINTNFTQAPFN